MAMDHIGPAVNAQPNHFQDLPFPDCADAREPPAEASKTAVREELASPAILTLLGGQDETSLSQATGMDPLLWSAITNVRGPMESWNSQHGSLRSKKQQKAKRQELGSDQPRQRYAFKLNPRENEIRLLQEVYYELLQKSHPSEQHPPLEQVLEKLEEGEGGGNRILHQYAQKPRKQSAPVEPKTKPNQRSEPAEKTEEQPMDLSMGPPKHGPQNEKLPSPPRQGPEQLTVVSELPPKSTHREQAPEPQDQGTQQETDDKKKREIRDLEDVHRAQQQVQWKNYLEKCAKLKTHKEQLSQKQIEELATEQWRQLQEQSRQQFNEYCSVRRRKQELSDLMTHLARTSSTPEQSQSQQGGESRKRPREVLDDPVLNLPSEKRAFLTPEDRANLAKIQHLFNRPEFEQKKRLLGQLPLQNVIDALAKQKRRSRKSDRKPLLLQDLISQSSPNLGQQPGQLHQDIPAELLPKHWTPQTSLL